MIKNILKRFVQILFKFYSSILQEKIQGRMAEPAKARVKIAWTLSLFSQADPGSSYGSA